MLAYLSSPDEVLPSVDPSRDEAGEGSPGATTLPPVEKVSLARGPFNFPVEVDTLRSDPESGGGREVNVEAKLAFRGVEGEEFDFLGSVLFGGAGKGEKTVG